MSIDFHAFSNLRLPGGYLLLDIAETGPGMIDPAGRPAVAKTTIVGNNLRIVLAQGMDAYEQSISIYHEILEGLTVAMNRPPSAVEDFLESDFEAAAVAAHARFGFAMPENVLNFLH